MIETIVGKRGRGKTSLVAEILTRQQRDQIFIFDYCGEFRQFAIPEFCYVENTGFRDFCHAVWDNSREGVSTLLVLDEVSIYGKNNPLVEHIYRLGRHKGIDIISTAQRFYMLPLIVRSQTDVFRVFQLTEERDINYLKNYVSDATLATIMGLDRFQYINLAL